MCLTVLSYVSYRINIFNRYLSMSFADVLFTYVFLATSITMISLFSIKFYHHVEDEIHICKLKHEDFTCVVKECIQYSVPYIGILYGFLTVVYKACDYLALTCACLCCLCCCGTSCCGVKDNEFIDDVGELQIETNPSSTISI